MMNDNQSRKYNMALAVQQVLNDHATDYTSLGALVTKKTELDQQLDTIRQVQGSRQADSSGTTRQKAEAREKMENMAMEICKPLAAYARDSKNSVLEAEIDFERSDFRRERSAESADMCQLVHARANTYITALGPYGITADKLTAFQEAITTFIALIPSTRTLSAGNSTATSALAGEFTKLMALLETTDDLMANFRNSNIAFYNTYFSARRIVDTGTRSVLLQVNVTEINSESPLRNVRVRIPEQGIETATNEDGHARLMSNAISQGIVTVQLSLDQYEDLSVPNVTIEEGKMLKLELKMRRK